MLNRIKALLHISNANNNDLEATPADNYHNVTHDNKHQDDVVLDIKLTHHQVNTVTIRDSISESEKVLRKIRCHNGLYFSAGFALTSGVVVAFCYGLVGVKGSQGIVPFWQQKNEKVHSLQDLFHSSQTDPILYRGVNYSYDCDYYLDYKVEYYGSAVMGNCNIDRMTCVINSCLTTVEQEPCKTIHNQLNAARCEKPPTIPTLLTITPVLLLTLFYCVCNSRYLIGDIYNEDLIKKLYDDYCLLSNSTSIQSMSLKEFKKESVMYIHGFFKNKDTRASENISLTHATVPNHSCC